MLVHQPPLASFPSLLSQDPMVNHSNLSLVSTFNSLDPLPLPHTPCQSPTPDSCSNLSSLCLHRDCQAQLERITQVCRLVPLQIYVFWPQLNYQHYFSTCPESAPPHIPFKGSSELLPHSPQPVILMTLPHILREIRLSVCGPSPTRNSDGLSGQVDHRAKVESRVGSTSYLRTSTVPGDHNHALYLHILLIKRHCLKYSFPLTLPSSSPSLPSLIHSNSASTSTPSLKF